MGSVDDVCAAMTDDAVRILMLARVPLLGQVKTRLARHVGAAQALQTHIELLWRNARIAAATGFHFELHYYGDLPSGSGLFRTMAVELGAELVPQVEGDIGVKMLAAAQFQSRPSVLIGADCGDLSVSYLTRAAAELTQSEVVLGPAEDGGYVLVGQRQPLAELFTDIDWGTDAVMQQTRQRLQDSDISYAELPLRWDVDGVEDLRRYWRKNAAGET